MIQLTKCQLVFFSSLEILVDTVTIKRIAALHQFIQDTIGLFFLSGILVITVSI